MVKLHSVKTTYTFEVEDRGVNGLVQVSLPERTMRVKVGGWAFGEWMKDDPARNTLQEYILISHFKKSIDINNLT